VIGDPVNHFIKPASDFKARNKSANTGVLSFREDAEGGRKGGVEGEDGAEGLKSVLGWLSGQDHRFQGQTC
jgi:hypothetical protein